MYAILLLLYEASAPRSQSLYFPNKITKCISRYNQALGFPVNEHCITAVICFAYAHALYLLLSFTRYFFKEIIAIELLACSRTYASHAG